MTRAQVTDLPLGCCGITLDLSVTYTPNSKSVSLSPRWLPFCDPCLTVYGDALWDESTSTWQGIALHGFMIRCCFGGCCPGGGGSYAELATAFDPGRVPGGFRGDEFEYVKFGFCGPGCCGGSWSLDATVYFSPSGGLFGFSRMKVAGEIPLWRGLSVTPTIEVVQGGVPAWFICCLRAGHRKLPCDTET